MMLDDKIIIVKPESGYVKVKRVDAGMVVPYKAQGWQEPDGNGYVSTQRGLTVSEIVLLSICIIAGSLIIFAAGPDVIQWGARKVAAWSSTLRAF